MQEEEYTDYSCSTAIERLSRDVETVLRSWHVDRGSDHHVTVGNSAFGRVSSSASLAAATSGGDTDLASIRLIRSNTLSWNLTLTTQQYGRTSITIDLELALWDAPGGGGGGGGGGPGSNRKQSGYQQRYGTSSSSSDNSFSDKYYENSNNNNNTTNNRLVKSLRRKPFGQMPAHDFLFDNFSTLFGIGQHISLTPIHPDPIPRELLYSIGESILRRNDGNSTARWVLANTLSGWLQTALNIATANCHTCIPTFGVWGQYRPNELVLNTELTSPKFSSGSSVVGGPSKTKSGSTSGGIGGGGGGGTASQSSVAGGKSTSVDSSDLLVGRTIRTEKEQQQQREQQKLKESSDRDVQKRKAGVQLFPHWAQAIRQVDIPTSSLSGGSVQVNQQFSPPFVVGHVLTPIRNDEPPSSSSSATPNSKQKHRKDTNKERRNNSNIPLYHIGANLWVSAYTITKNGNTSGNNKSMPLSGPSVLAGSARLAVWAGILLQHCPEDAMVVLTGARHVFGWFKERNKVGSNRGLFFRALDINGDRRDHSNDWRMGGDEDEYQHGLAAVIDLTDDEFTIYKRQCQMYVQEILEHAWGCKDRKVPLWGSKDDPVAAVYATTTWSGKSSNDQGSTGDNDPVIEPLLTFPLRIRSRRELSKRDWAEMEESVEKTILDPTSPSRFCIQTFYDRDTSVSTLAASQRCVLAAMIRSATLPNETLLHHLTDVDLVSLWDDDSGRQVARKLAERSHVGSSTKRIVDAMDWSNAVAELISVREAEYVVHSVMNGSLTAGFPTCPEDSFIEHDLLSPFRKSAPWGRLLSVLFAHMARLRELSSIALVWRVFCQELRRRWDSKESLPNMMFVAGLDPHPLVLYEKRSFSTIGLKANFAAFLNCTEPDPDDFNCLIGQKLQVFNLGVECIVAEELLENEALEKFLGAGQLPASLSINDEEAIESQDVPSVTSTVGAAPETLSLETPSPEKKEKWPKSNVKKPDFTEKNDYGPPTIDRDLDFWVMDEAGHAPTLDVAHATADIVDDTGFDYVEAAPSNLGSADDDSSNGDLYQSKSKRRKSIKNGKTSKNKNVVVEGLPDKPWEGTVMNGSEDSLVTSGELSQAYFDAAEAGSIFSTKNGFVNLDTVVNVADMKRRPGARCPVQNATLGLTGDQLYAPYLQRPYPVTDDVALERKIMLAKSCEGEEKRGALQARLEISQRLQRPKLLSDMSSFKAANPKCTIDDFTRWYGNPGSPLDDYNDDPIGDDFSVQSAYQESAAHKLDKASEAMRVLVATRDFWGKTWEEAKPIPAAEQQPLFDYNSTVEMVLDYLEQLHPANLMNQVMGVNLSSAYFALASSAKGTMKIGIVQLSMKRLRQKIEKALDLLSRDATGALSQLAENGSTAASTTSSLFASEEAICACEDACNALSVTETMVARATSLLHKFPGQYKLISDLLRFNDGSTLALIDPVGRSSFLKLVYEQQQRRRQQQQQQQQQYNIDDPSKDSLPDPLLREYVFRNLDDENPCQLAVRFGDDDGTTSLADNNGDTNEGGVLLALMRSNVTSD